MAEQRGSGRDCGNVRHGASAQLWFPGLQSPYDPYSGANLQWSDEYHTSANDYDLFALDATGTTVVASSADGHRTERVRPWNRSIPFHMGERIVSGRRMLLPALSAAVLHRQPAGDPDGRTDHRTCSDGKLRLRRLCGVPQRCT